MRIQPTMRLFAVCVLAPAAVAMFGGLACGDTTEADPTPVQTFKITPADGGTPLPSPTAAAATPTSSTPSSGTPLTIAAVGSEFDVEEAQAAAGPVTIEFDNRDAGIVHNFHVYKGDDSSGESVAESELDV